ncbi:MAG TPA: hypothetical protein VFO05_07650 [Candidatus Limnocylindrales bacterium]|nr:hypothetical protein [Candidatus Limnocylindrales bacterium]
MPHVTELHEQHDPILIVSLAGGDLTAADRDFATARSLVGSCPDCARLHDDVLALASATKALPPALRTRDFRITSEQAAKLRPAGLRGVLARLTAPGGLFSRQLGVGLATLGIAGLLIGSLPSINLGMAGAAPASSQAARAPETVMGAPAASSAASEAPAYGPNAAFGSENLATSEIDTAAGPPASGDQSTRNDGGAAVVNPTPVPARTAAPADEDRVATLPLDAGSSGGPSPLVIVSIALLAAGVVLLVLRRVAGGASSR